MKTLLKTTGISVLVLFGALASTSAMADRDGHVRFGVTLGVPLYAPYYGYAYPAYPYPAYPPVVVQSAPPVYVEQGAAQAVPAPAPAAADWYYCPASKSYYPYVSECPGGWQRVPSQPPR
jgi:hypothetical protein